MSPDAGVKTESGNADRQLIGEYWPMAIELQPPPDPELNEMADGSHLFRVGFWRHQKPPPGTDIAQEEMGWGVEWWDVSAEDVHEVIEWAEAKADAEQIYTLYVRFTDPYSGREWMIGVAGADPTVVSDSFRRRHPVRD